MARMIALIYNWWTLFVRLAKPDSHLEAITSRPLLLGSVGRLTESGRQKKLTISSHHNLHDTMKVAYQRIAAFFDGLKLIAPQLSIEGCWRRILTKAMAAFMPKTDEIVGNGLPAPS